jgi:hypothetical protein
VLSRDFIAFQPAGVPLNLHGILCKLSIFGPPWLTGNYHPRSGDPTVNTIEDCQAMCDRLPACQTWTAFTVTAGGL